MQHRDCVSSPPAISYSRSSLSLLPRLFVVGCCSYHRVPDAVAQQAAPLPEMSGYKIIMEVSVLVVIVLCIGTTAALTAN